ncbi:MAG: GatB/YqeY domain-containing protein [Gammaproteobacteria bacterium]|nr:GatB/YqeY domain-containing protein [Gammaproteobacteria bacterium]
MASALKQRITDDVKQAMRDKDKHRLGTLRMITAAIKQKEVDERVELDDNGVLAALDKMAKQYRDSIEQYRQAGRDDLVEKEATELNIITEYLPEQLNDTDLEALIKKAIEDTGAEGMQDMGKVMGELKPKMQGRADMSAVSAKVKAPLS